MSQNVLITGANRGIGLALTEAYLARGDKVYAVCRESTDELSKTGAEIISGIDVSQVQDIKNLKKQMKGINIDILINNAGILRNESLSEMNFESITEEFSINSLGPLRVTHALLENLHDGSKIALMTSRMGSIEDNGSGGYYGYRMSKAALNAAGKSLANDLKPRKISVAILHPGFVSTRMVNFSGNVSAADSAKDLVARIDELSLASSGTFWHANGEILPW